MKWKSAQTQALAGTKRWAAVTDEKWRPNIVWESESELKWKVKVEWNEMKSAPAQA